MPTLLFGVGVVSTAGLGQCPDTPQDKTLLFFQTSTVVAQGIDQGVVSREVGHLLAVSLIVLYHLDCLFRTVDTVLDRRTPVLCQ